MTRQEFIDTCDDFSELKNFCNEYNCYELDDVYDSDDRDYYIDAELADNRDGWRDVRDWLRNIDDCDDWYERNDYGEWIGIDDDFEYYQQRVIDWCEENGIFDDEEEEEESQPEPVTEEEQEFEPFEQDFSVDELLSATSTVYDSIEQERAAFAAEAERAAEEFRREAEEARAREQAELDAAFGEFVSDICSVA